MAKYNTKNEIIKKQYEQYLELDEGLSEQTIYGKIKDLRKYENFTDFKCFSTFNKDQALAFKAKYKTAKNYLGGDMSYSTIWRTTNNLKEFFQWLSRQNNYKSKIKYDHIRAFNLTKKEENVAKKRPYRKYPSMEQMKAVIHGMPTNTEIERRDKALIAFTLLTGARVNAIISLKIRNIDEYKKYVEQDPQNVATKFSKYILTQFLPVGSDIEQIVLDWVKYLKETKLLPYEAPLFPAAKSELDKETQLFITEKLSGEHISSTTTVRTIFKSAFENISMMYYHPHSIRRTLVNLGERTCKSPEEFKAWSQNLGHDEVLTTFTSYGSISMDRQREIISSFSAG